MSAPIGYEKYPPTPTVMECPPDSKGLLRAGATKQGEEAKTPSPTRMLHSTYFTDGQRYLPKTTGTSGSGLQHKTSASPSGPIAGNNMSPIVIGSYRLPIDLEPIVQGVIFFHVTMSISRVQVHQAPLQPIRLLYFFTVGDLSNI